MTDPLSSGTDRPLTTDPSTLMRAEELVYDLSIVRHMLGVGIHIAKKDWGFRNYFNSCPGHADLPSLERLEKMGLVNRGRPNYWHVTEAGCKAIGLTDKQIKKAFAP